MADKLALTLHALSAETSSSTGASTDIGLLRRALIIDFEVPLVAGTTPELIVELQTSPDDTNFRLLRRFDGLKKATARERVYLWGAERFIRVKWTITGGGGESFTFSVLGEAHVTYADPDDTNLPSATIQVEADDVVAEKFLKASDEAEGYLGAGFTLPLIEWSQDLREHVANMADFAILKKRGFDVEGQDEIVRMGRKDAIAWLSKVATGAIKPPGILDSDAGTLETGAHVSSQIKRGWNC